MKSVVFLTLSVLTGFSAGALATFMFSFTYSVLRHGGLW